MVSLANYTPSGDNRDRLDFDLLYRQFPDTGKPKYQVRGRIIKSGDIHEDNPIKVNVVSKDGHTWFECGTGAKIHPELQRGLQDYVDAYHAGAFSCKS